MDRGAWQATVQCGKPLQYSCLENPMNRMKSQEDMKLEDEPSKLVGFQYVAGEEQRNSSRRNEEAKPKQKGLPIVYMSGGESKV